MFILPDLWAQWLGLSLYAFFVGFGFCDGFQMHTVRKLIWFAIFLAFCMDTFYKQGQFDIPVILSVTAPLAFVLCYTQKMAREKK